MLLICKEQNLKKVGEIFEKWDLEYSVIGKTNESNSYKVLNLDEKLYERNMESFDDVNDYTNIPLDEVRYIEEIKCKKIKDMSLWEIYDSTVGNRTIKGSDKPGSYAVLDIYEVNKQLVLTWGENFDECYKIISKMEGIKPLCMVNCLNFGDPKYCLNDLKDTIDDLSKKCKEFKIPIVGGNVSLYNTTGSESIRPTPILVMMGISC
jgi:phosphoribosylformylglycinamidine (FGAM) synthase-like enzyme